MRLKEISCWSSEAEWWKVSEDSLKFSRASKAKGHIVDERKTAENTRNYQIKSMCLHLIY